MNTVFKFLTKSLFALTFCGALGLTSVRAHDGGGDDDGQCGGDIDGAELVHVDLVMTPTASAPAGSSIRLSFEAKDDDGVTEAELKLKARSLVSGTYSVSVTLKSDGSAVALGIFTVNAEGEAEIEFSRENESDHVTEHHHSGGGDDDGDDDGGDDNEVTSPFPDGFNPLDIATVTVSDANSTPLFTANLTNVTSGSMNISATVQATAGAGAPNANGTASISAALKKNRVNGSLRFVAHSLQGKLPVTLTVNGAAAKNLKTDKRGNLAVKLQPSGKNGTIAGVSLTSVHTVILQDKSGNALLIANF